MTQEANAGGHGQDGENGHGQAPVVHYEVDTEPQVTHLSRMTPTQILSAAGLDSATYYLILLGPHGETSYKDKPYVEIDMKNGMRFMSQYIGPTPVS